MGSRRLKAPFSRERRGGSGLRSWALRAQPGVRPAGWGPADSKPRDTGGRVMGSCLPRLLPRPTPERLTW